MNNSDKLKAEKTSLPSHRDDAPNPDSLLRHIQRQQRGLHKIYVGMSAGVGKTYRALQEIRERRDEGLDAIVGLLETHGREDTVRMAEGLDVFPCKVVNYKSVELTEMDVEGLLERKPQLVLVDELAHTNVPGQKNEKRYDDIEELLQAGINVISTMNVQHLESVNDLVERLTGVRVKERVPDWVLREADEVILVDVTPEVLRERLKSGKIYSRDKIEQSLDNFFTSENLTILRELALRQVADVVEESHLTEPTGVKERIAVAITATPNATRLIRRGAHLAHRLDGELFIIHVRNRKLTREQERFLDTCRVITESLEGQFFQLENTDVIKQLATFMKEQRITQILVGESPKRFIKLGQQRFSSRLLEISENADVIIIRSEANEE
jgi:two-component system, OmpR family, sensor histidine kinase KdpD